MVKIQRLTSGQFTITIPKRLAELKGWDKGTDLVFKDHTKDSFILVMKKEDEDAKDVKKETKQKNEQSR